MRTVLALSACLVLLGGTNSFAAVPNATLSTTPAGIPLVGESGAPDPVGAVTYVIRNAANNIKPGVTVVLDFTDCTDVRISSDAAPGTTINCAAHTVSGITDGLGSVTFRIVGSGVAGAPRATGACLRAYANGVIMRPSIISAFDLDGSDGVDGIDLGIFSADFFSGQYRGRSDYNGDGVLNGLDVGLMARALLDGGSQQSGVPCSP